MKRLLRHLLLSFFLFLFLGQGPDALAATYYVDGAAGNDTAGTGTQGAPWKTLVKAENAAASGDSVYVKTGTYVENAGSGYISFAKAISWMGRSADWSGAGAVTVQEATNTATAYITGTNAVSFANFVFDGQNAGGHVLRISSGAGKSFTGCTFENGTSGGALVRVDDGGTASFSASTFTHTGNFIFNVAAGGGILVDGSIISETSGGVINSTSTSTMTFHDTDIAVSSPDNNVFNQYSTTGTLVISRDSASKGSLAVTGGGANWVFYWKGSVTLEGTAAYLLDVDADTSSGYFLDDNGGTVTETISYADITHTMSSTSGRFISLSTAALDIEDSLLHVTGGANLLYSDSAAALTLDDNTIVYAATKTDASVIQLMGTGADTITGNDIDVSSSVAFVGTVIQKNSGTDSRISTGDFTLGGNAIDITSTFTNVVYVAHVDCVFSVTDNVIAASSTTASNAFVLRIYDVPDPSVTNNTITTASTGAVSHIVILPNDVTGWLGTGTATISGNTLYSKSHASGYIIELGEDGSSGASYEQRWNGSVIEHNTIYGPAWYGDTATYSVHDILVGHNIKCQVRYNRIVGGSLVFVIKDGTGSGLDWNHEGGVYGNVIINPTYAAILSKGALNLDIYHNTIYAGPAYGISYAIEIGESSAGYPSTGNRVFYNAVYSRSDRRLIGVDQYSTTGFTAYGNVYWNEAGSLAAQPFSFNDVAYNGFTAWNAAIGGGDTSLLADPRFADAAAYDVSLLSASPAIDAAAAVSGYTADISGHAFAGNPDIGAYEYRSPDNNLGALSLSSGTLYPSFAAGTTSYRVGVGSAVSSLTVTPTVNEAHATVRVNGTAVTSGSASNAISLDAGTNTLTIVVTAQDATTKTYTVIVSREASYAISGPVTHSEVSIQTASAASVAAPAVTHTAGNLIAVFVASFGTPGTITVSDTQTNTYAAAGNIAVPYNNVYGQWFYAFAQSTGSNTVTANFTVSASYRTIRVLEYSNIRTASPVDAYVTGSGATSPAFSTTSVRDLVLAAFHADRDITVTPETPLTGCAAGVGYTLTPNDYCSTGVGRPVEQRITSDTLTGATAALVPTGGAVWSNFVVAFKGVGPAAFSPAAGTYYAAQHVALSSTFSGATLCYTTDGSDPVADGAGNCVHGSTYSTPISITSTTTLKALSSKVGQADSDVVSATYTIPPIALISHTEILAVGTSGTSVTASAVTHTAGNLIAVFLAAFNPLGGQTLSVTDSQNNIYSGSGVDVVVGDPADPWGYVTGGWFYTFAKSTGSNTVTGHFNGAYYTLRVLEYSGVSPTDPLDVSGIHGTGTTSPAFSTSMPNELILAAWHMEWVTAATAGAGYAFLPAGSLGSMGAGGVNHPVEARVAVAKLTDTTAAIVPTDGTVSGSWVVSFNAASNETVDTPVLSLAAGTYPTTQSVTITDATAGAAIHYTTDGSTPTVSSALYSGALSISSTQTLKAIATKADMLDSAVASAAYTIASDNAIAFTTIGSTFSPIIKVTGTPTILWTFADGSTSNALHPSVNFGSGATRVSYLTVTPWSALTDINLGYDHSDGGINNESIIATQAQQNVTNIAHLSLAAASLVTFAASYNPITALDFTGFAAVQRIECYYCTALASIELQGTDALFRLCLENANLTSLDISGSPSLADLRGALQGPANTNAFTIDWGDIGAHIWHICIRDNYGMTDTTMSFGQFPLLQELFNWGTAQTGTLAPSSTALTSVQSYGNSYTAVDLGGLYAAGHNGYVDISHNLVSSVDITDDPGLTHLDLHHNSLSQAAVDGILGVLDAYGTSNHYVNLTENSAPSAADGAVHAANLVARGWTVLTVTPTLDAPTFSPAAGSYFASQSVALSDSNAGATICYRTDGIDPTAATPGTCDAGSTAYVGGNPIAVGLGTTTFKVLATKSGMNNSAVATAVFVISTPSSDADLSALVLSQGTLSPSFVSSTLSYTASTANSTANLTVTPTLDEAHATVTVNGTNVASGSASGNIALAVGSNAITILVTAQDGTTQKAYTVTVTRAASSDADLSALTISDGTLSPTFAAGTTSYAASVANGTASLTVTPTVDQTDAAVTVNTQNVVSGSASQAIILGVGSNAITILVTAQDSSTKSYTLTVTRAQASSGGGGGLVMPTVSAPVFSPGAGTYSSSQSVTLSSATAATSIRYTLDGTTPTGTSALYAAPIVVDKSLTIKAIALRSGYKSSSVVSAAYVIEAAAPVTPATPEIPTSPTTMPDGTLLKAPASFKVYVLIEGKKKWISTPEMFEQLGYQWTNVTNLTEDQLAAITDYEDNLIRAAGDYKVYLVVSGIRRHIPNPAIFLDYGFGWNDVRDVDRSVIERYPEATLLKQSGKEEVYFVKDGARKWIPSKEVFASYSDKEEDIQVISALEMAAYPISHLIRLAGSPDVYYLEGASKRRVPSIEIFDAYRMDWSRVFTVNQKEFDSYPTGEDVS